jgi:AraC-like DNA-binding protein
MDPGAGRQSPLLNDPPHRATVAAGFVTGLMSGLAGRPREAEALLAAAGLPARILGDARLRAPIGGYAALYNAVVAHLGDEAFGLLPHPVRPGAFEFLCRGLLGSRDLGEALDRASRFLAVVLPDLSVELARTEDVAPLRIHEARGTWRRRDDPRRIFAYEWLLRLLHGLACWLVARPIPLESVRFPYLPPPHAADYALIYTPHATFRGESLEATFDAALLALPVRRDEAELAAFLEGAPGKIAMLYRRDRESARAVRDHLARVLPLAGSLADTARALRIAPRTLHRRLQAEGTSFRAVKDALRRELAIAWLARGDRSVAQVAADLGYSEPSAFFRAFHAWTGQSPSSWRRLRGQTLS